MKKIVGSFNSILLKMAATENKQIEMGNIVFEQVTSSMALKNNVLNDFTVRKYRARLISYNTGNKIKPAETGGGATDISQRLVKFVFRLYIQLHELFYYLCKNLITNTFYSI